MEGHLRIIDKEINLLNIDGPYYYRKIFWEEIIDEGLLQHPNFIIGGDLNMVLSGKEVWGRNNILDVLAPFFSTLFEEVGLVDIEPSPIRPTW